MCGTYIYSVNIRCHFIRLCLVSVWSNHAIGKTNLAYVSDARAIAKPPHSAAVPFYGDEDVWVAFRHQGFLCFCVYVFRRGEGKLFYTASEHGTRTLNLICS